MKSNRFFNLFHTGLIVIILMISGCSESPEQASLRIGMNTWPGYEALMLAKEEKLLGSEVKISRLDSATDVIKAFRSNIIDVACITLDEAMILQSKLDEPLKVITVLDFSMGGDVIIAKNQIDGMSMLKGQRIGVESSALGSYMISRAVDLTEGLNLEDIDIVHIGYEHHEDAFLNGMVDAIVTFEPVKTRLLAKNARVIFDSSRIPGEIVDVLVVKERIIQEKEASLRSLVDGYFHALNRIEKEYEKSIEQMASYEKISVQEFRTAFRGLKIPSREENRKFFDEQIGQTMEKLESLLLEHSLLEKPVSASLIVYDGFIRHTAP